jgi:transcriptional antiterminator Rof (Rho-off)
MTSDYRPIACDAYSTLEMLVLRRRRVTLAYSDGGAIREVAGIPVDLVTRQGAEYLEVAVDGDALVVQLDRLQSILDGSDRVFQRQFSDE